MQLQLVLTSASCLTNSASRSRPRHRHRTHTHLRPQHHRPSSLGSYWTGNESRTSGAAKIDLTKISEVGCGHCLSGLFGKRRSEVSSV